ncbi:LLM class flavin-dependent oxidoreductase [Phenylobacterium aquaticum]|uniref:LLM class flavin-dependent oxidoreductase n=1 Tax=Phenylobacterium aquaticum TaxID=1763816 RepID=UPI001F5DB5E9|nr:LLM class flavin-dependent oxidoreductase [Phenylobacterium aquaticum]MCI3135631.1 LLM class flavin-dependent oxidoreductase [Phenylobacterium aquaticum]
MSKRHIRLGAFLFGVGHHLAAWRAPEVDPAAYTRFEHFRDLTLSAERAGFDAVFFADNVALPGAPLDVLSRGAQAYYWEPLTLLAALATQTDRIGLIATVSSTYLPPYHLARKFASLDHLSNGRVGWNLVTSGSDAEARNFGLDHQLGHADRYARAREYIQVVQGLWDSWDDDAHLFDKAAQRVFDPAKVRPLNHVGQHYAVAGPLQSARPVQGHPVIVQAGSSDDGKDLAAASAEVVFTAQQDLAEARDFYADLKARAAACGRAPDQILVMPGVMPFVAATEAQARAKLERLQALVDPKAALRLLSGFLGVDASGFDLDAPLPDLPVTEGWQSRQKLFADLTAREGLTVRDLLDRVVPARGHKVVVGDPGQVADLLEDWFAGGAADGFNILPATLPGGLDDFNALVVPELRRRGLISDQPEGATLRDHLGLARPAARVPEPSLEPKESLHER